MKTASKVYTALIFIFLYAPIIVLIIFSFNDTDTASRTQFSGFTLRWYQRLFEDRYILEALLNTLIIAVVSAFASTVLGTMAAVGINRMKRMPKKVMMNITNFPMVNPEIVTAKNVARFKSQLQALGLSFDWDREINTTDPEYYKWTQWIFLQLYKHGLAYKKEMNVNWCTGCKCVLANEEVVNGVCERCGGEVVRKVKSQWMLRITAYAQKLLDLSLIHISEPTRH